MSHCRVQHEELNTRSRAQHEELTERIREIHAAIIGNGSEGLKSRVSRHSQQIAHVEKEVTELRNDVDTRLDELKQSIGALNIRFWKMAIIVATLVVGLNKAVQVMDVRSIIGM